MVLSLTTLDDVGDGPTVEMVAPDTTKKDDVSVATDKNIVNAQTADDVAMTCADKPVRVRSADDGAARRRRSCC